MATITIIDNADISLWFHEEGKIVHHQLHRFLKGDPLRSTLLKGVELLRDRNACKWLSDDRLGGSLTPEDSEWGATVFASKAIEAGWKYWALILPEIILGQLNMNLAIDDYTRKGLIIKLFTNSEEALNWLKSVE